MEKQAYIFRVGNNPIRAKYRGCLCRVIRRGAMNTILVEFEDGHRMTTSGNFIRRIEKLRPHIEQRLNDAIRAFDFEGEVEKAAGACISECVQNWFRYGDGNDLIQRAVSVALEESLSGLIKKINKKRNHGR
jgi:hypothetical protein